MSKVLVYGYATFGHPNDFRQRCFFPSNQHDSTIKSFDLSNNAIKIFPGTSVYGIRKEIINGNIGMSYSRYSYAKEMSSEREGTFIGSSIVVINGVIDESKIFEKLNIFHDELTKMNLMDDRLLVNHSDAFRIAKSALNEVDKLSSNLKINTEKLSNYLSNSNLLILAKTDATYLKKSIKLLNKYDNIFFTTNHDVFKNVLRKGIFKCIDENNNEFEVEIEKIEIEKNQKKQQILKNLEREQQHLIQNIKNKASDLKLNLSQMIKKHSENTQVIDVFQHNVSEINTLENNLFSKFDIARKNFENSNDEQTATNEVRSIQAEFSKFINSIKSNYEVIEVKNIKRHDNHPFETRKNPHDEYVKNIDSDDRKPNANIMLATVIGIALIVIVLWYYLSIKPKHENEIQNLKIEIETLVQNQEEDKESKKPTELLDENGLKKINDKLTLSETRLHEVIKIIVSENPKSIGNHIKRNVKDYTQKIYLKNKNNFKITNDEKDTILEKKLKNVPYFKEN